MKAIISTEERGKNAMKIQCHNKTESAIVRCFRIRMQLSQVITGDRVTKLHKHPYCFYSPSPSSILHHLSSSVYDSPKAYG